MGENIIYIRYNLKCKKCGNIFESNLANVRCPNLLPSKQFPDGRLKK
jgi:Zn finger protein HypA/HybF involved in hydrogenase expression